MDIVRRKLILSTTGTFFFYWNVFIKQVEFRENARGFFSQEKKQTVHNNEVSILSSGLNVFFFERAGLPTIIFLFSSQKLCKKAIFSFIKTLVRYTGLETVSENKTVMMDKTFWWEAVSLSRKNFWPR